MIVTTVHNNRDCCSLRACDVTVVGSSPLHEKVTFEVPAQEEEDEDMPRHLDDMPRHPEAYPPHKTPRAESFTNGGQVTLGVSGQDFQNNPEQAAQKVTRQIGLQLDDEALETFRNASGYHRSKRMMMYLAEPPPEATPMDMWRWRVASFMDNGIVRGILMLVIALNAVVIGIQTDYGTEGGALWTAIDVSFVIIYTIELMLNFFGFGWLFFEDMWNWADVFIVFSSIIDTLINAVQGSAASGVGVVRLLRVVRVVMRLTRLVKLISFVTALSFDIIVNVTTPLPLPGEEACPAR